MEVKIDRAFRNDIHKIKDQSLLKRIADSIQRIQHAENRAQITDLKKLKGSTGQFRIKIGNYRIGLIIEGDKAVFVRFLHRKDIYKFFPKK